MLLVLLIGIAIGLLNGVLVVVSRVPDIVVTLAMLFVWAGAALLVLEHARRRLGAVAATSSSAAAIGIDLVPRALVVLLVIVGAGLDPAAPIPPGAVAVRHRQRTSWPPSAAAWTWRARRSLRTRFAGFFGALGGLCPHRQHRHRHARSRARTCS